MELIIKSYWLILIDRIKEIVFNSQKQKNDLTCKAFRFPWSCRYANATRQIGEIMSYNAFFKQDAHGSESGNKAMSRTSMGCNLHGDRYGSPNYSVSYSRTQPLINIGLSLAGF